MQLTSRVLTQDDVNRIVAEVSRDYYDHNLTVETRATSAHGIGIKLGTNDSHGIGSRRSWSGRHGKWACWHAFRDVLAGIFLADPNARVRTSMTVYKGAEGFLSEYPETAYTNVGSMMSPAYMPEQCDCGSHWESSIIHELNDKVMEAAR